MRLNIYQIDAFSQQVFAGNPAAVVPLESWLADDRMQAIAAENNLAETAFFVPTPHRETDYQLRWFTPTVEVDLCGHATLASAWLLFNLLGYASSSIRFASRSGVLKAEQIGASVRIDLPARASAPIECPMALSEGLGCTPNAVRSGANLIAILDSQAQLQAIKPDFSRLACLHPQGVIVTAAGETVDVVSRYFAPSFGIDEDPVTGSAHADLAPYWCERLGRKQFSARQLSARGGDLEVELQADRVLLTGAAALYLQGEIRLPD